MCVTFSRALAGLGFAPSGLVRFSRDSLTQGSRPGLLTAGPPALRQRGAKGLFRGWPWFASGRSYRPPSGLPPVGVGIGTRQKHCPPPPVRWPLLLGLTNALYASGWLASEGLLRRLANRSRA